MSWKIKNDNGATCEIVNDGGRVVALVNTSNSLADARLIVSCVNSKSSNEEGLLLDALRSLTEAILTKSDHYYMARQIKNAVQIMAAHGISTPTPFFDVNCGKCRTDWRSVLVEYRADMSKRTSDRSRQYEITPRQHDRQVQDGFAPVSAQVTTKPA